MSQPCAFVDPSSLSLPSSSSRFPSPASSTDGSPSAEPPRKRPRSVVTPEERKEARAHRNRIAAQNSRDRRKAQFTYLERRVAELEDENRRLRAGILTPSTALPDPIVVEREREQQRKREEEQRERENQELRERIRTLEKGYEAVVRALAAQGNLSNSGIPTPPPTSPAPTVPSDSQSSLHPSSGTEPREAPSSSTVPSLPLSPTSSNSTLSPLLFSSGDSFDFSTTFPASEPSLALPEESFDLSLANSTPTRHLARVANIAGNSAMSLQRVGGARMVMGSVGTTKCRAVIHPRFPEDEAASDAAITRLFAEILASPPLGSSALPSCSTSSEDAPNKEVLMETSKCGLGKSNIDWDEQVCAEMEMEKLLDILPDVQDVGVDAILNSGVNLDVDMDFSNTLTWDGVSVF